jgi:DNA (cytosine-5)-methyltransferase 1
LRPPAIRIHSEDLIIDSFAGGGGASLGIEWATGRSPDIAINHDGEALAMHAANHPKTKHFCENVWDVDPRKACKGRRIALAWFSPDCTFHSKARGGKPFRDRDPARRRRGLAWVVVRWAKAVKPRVIMLENVEEFQDWGPLDEQGAPDRERRGFTFRRWLAQLENCGYRVEMRELRACDFGAPTTRKRLFIIARCDGEPIVWPAPTHGHGRQPYRTAAECIEWSIACPSIFERKRPLAENTLRRIARGIRRYVIEAKQPFIIGAGGPARQGEPRGVGQPMTTILASEHHRCLVEPFIVPVAHAGDERAHSVTEPLRTVTAAHRGEHALVAPFLARHYSEREPYVRAGKSLDEPLPTITTSDHHSLVAPTLIQTGYGERPGQAPRALDLHAPLGTVVGGGAKHALVSAFIARHYGGHENDGSSPQLPMFTVTTKDHHALVASHLLKLRGDPNDHPNTAQDLREPAPTLTANGNHLAEVRAFLVKFYGTDQDPQLSMPMHTVTTKDRFGLVTVHGVDYVIADIGMRMLVPRELFRAQGFPDSYRIEIPFNGKPMTKTAQVRMCGNSVSPYMSEALVRANLGERRASEVA